MCMPSRKLHTHVCPAGVCLCVCRHQGRPSPVHPRQMGRDSGWGSASGCPFGQQVLVFRNWGVWGALETIQAGTQQATSPRGVPSRPGTHWVPLDTQVLQVLKVC